MWFGAWGKILGAFFGFSLAGPIGALFGLFVGNFFDKGLKYARGTSLSALRGQTRKVFHQVTFSVMGHIAKSDGRVSEEEIRVTREMMRKMHLNHKEQREAVTAFTQGKLAGFQLGVTLTELKYACRQHPSLLKTFVEIQYQAVMGTRYQIMERKTNVHKQQLLNSVFQQLGFKPVFPSQQQYQQQYTYTPPPYVYVDELAEAYKILEISAHTTDVEIKKAYRKQMSQHHPDKLIAKGLSEKVIKQGTEKAQKIQAAYERIRRARGF